jgi:hypothetical protein
MKRYLWVVEIKYPNCDWEVFDFPEINTREACRKSIAIEKTWPDTGSKLRIVKYVPQEKAK